MSAGADVAPLVSVCIPVYNGESFVGQAIRSVLSQTFGQFELLIVDNCSTDRTAEVIATFRDSRILYVRNEENIGSIANFNRCIELARGEFFLLLPHDDLLEPPCLAAFSGVFKRHAAVGIVYSAFHTIDRTGRRLASRANHPDDKLLSCEETVRDVVDHFHPIQLAMSRTAILQSLGGFDIRLACFSDIHLWMRTTFLGWSACYLREPLFCNRIHEDQGQNFTKQNTSENMKKLSEHFGRPLDRQFFADNHYNQSLFTFVRFFLAEMQAHGYGSARLRRALVKKLLKSSVRNLLLSVKNGNGFMCRRESALLWSLPNLVGFWGVCRCCIEVAAEALVSGGGRALGRRRHVVETAAT